MNASSSVFSRLNFVRVCKTEYRIGLWQCPQFLFIIMGGVTIVAMITTYLVGTLYAEPEVVVFVVMAVTALLFSIGNVVVSNFEQIALLNRTKSEFIGIVSHQLRAPLTSMKWTLGLLLSGRLGPLGRDHVQHIEILHESNNQMLSLVNDLLDANRIEMGEFVFTIGSIDLAKITAEVIHDLAPLAQASNVKVIFEEESQDRMAKGDPDRVKMVIENLLDNAIKYTPSQGGIAIKIKETEEGMRVSIRDGGVGIPKGQQKHVFEKFFRASNAKKEQTHGTGLGLFISKSIVEALKGKIGFESKENGGSTFWFVLPRE